MSYPEKIWLFDFQGGETVWCDSPDPEDGMDAEDATEYVRTDVIPFKAIHLAKVELMKSRHKTRRTGGHEAYQATVDAVNQITAWLNEHRA